MFRDRWERHRVGSREIGDAPVPAGELSENAPPGRVGQGGEGPVQVLRRIFNHLVKYITAELGLGK